MKTVSTFQWWVNQFSLIHSSKGFLSPRAPVLSEAQQFSDKHGAVSTLGISWSFPMSEDTQVRQSSNKMENTCKKKVLTPKGENPTPVT